MDARNLLVPVIVGLAAGAFTLAIGPRLAPASPRPVAMAQSLPETKGVTVTGTGRVSVKPDLALIRMGVQSQAETAAAAQQANAQKMDAVVRALKDLKVADKDIQTSSISLRPLYEMGRDVKQQRVVGYEASNVVMVRILDLAKVGATLDEAVKVGANVASGIQLGLQNDAEQRKEALKNAVQNARGKAEAIASATGRGLGEIESVVEESIFTPRPMDTMRLEAAPAGASTPIEPGELEIVANVRVVYGL